MSCVGEEIASAICYSYSYCSVGWFSVCRGGGGGKNVLLYCCLDRCHVLRKKSHPLYPLHTLTVASVGFSVGEGFKNVCQKKQLGKKKILSLKSWPTKKFHKSCPWNFSMRFSVNMMSRFWILFLYLCFEISPLSCWRHFTILKVLVLVSPLLKRIIHIRLRNLNEVMIQYSRLSAHLVFMVRAGSRFEGAVTSLAFILQSWNHTHKPENFDVKSEKLGRRCFFFDGKVNWDYSRILRRDFVFLYCSTTEICEILVSIIRVCTPLLRKCSPRRLYLWSEMVTPPPLIEHYYLNVPPTSEFQTQKTEVLCSR